MTSVTEWMFRNRETGRYTIGQPANLSQKLFLCTTLVGIFLPRGPVRTAAGVAAVGMLAWWAVDEVARGVNPFRRILGVIAIGGIAYLARRRS